MAAKTKKRGKWIQKARAKMKKRGTLGSYGHHSEKQQKRDIKRGGKLGKKAQFALNMRRLAKKRTSKTAKRTRKRTSRR